MGKEIKSHEKETYISPDIMTLDIETEQSILQSGSGVETESWQNAENVDW